MSDKTDTRTGRVMVTLLHPGTGKELNVWTNVATLAERERLTELAKELDQKEKDIQQKYPDFYEYTNSGLDTGLLKEILERNPNIGAEAKLYAAAMKDVQVIGAFELIHSSIDTNDGRLDEATREMLREPIDGDFWRSQPVEEVQAAAKRFRSIAGF